MKSIENYKVPYTLTKYIISQNMKSYVKKANEQKTTTKQSKNIQYNRKTPLAIIHQS